MNKLIEWVPEIDWFRALVVPLNASFEEILYGTGLDYDDFQDKYSWRTTDPTHVPPAKNEVWLVSEKTSYNAQLKRNIITKEYLASYSSMDSVGARILLNAILRRYFGILPEGVSLKTYSAKYKNFYLSAGEWSLSINIEHLASLDLAAMQRDIEAGLTNQVEYRQKGLPNVPIGYALAEVQKSSTYALLFDTVHRLRKSRGRKDKPQL